MTITRRLDAQTEPQRRSIQQTGMKQRSMMIAGEALSNHKKTGRALGSRHPLFPPVCFWPQAARPHYPNLFLPIGCLHEVHFQHCLGGSSYTTLNRLFSQSLVGFEPVAPIESVVFPIHLQNIDRFLQPNLLDAVHQRRNLLRVVRSRNRAADLRQGNLNHAWVILGWHVIECPAVLGLGFKRTCSVCRGPDWPKKTAALIVLSTLYREAEIG